MRRFILAGIVILLIGIGCFFMQSQKGDEMVDWTQTDPEFAALWANFMDKDVKTQGKLEPKTRYLVVLAAHIAASPSAEAYKTILAEALENEISPIEAKEVVYQAVPYVGMAKAYDFLNATNEVLKEKGISLPLAAQARTTSVNRFDEGLNAQRSIFGAENIDTMRANAPAELKHIQDYLSANCFGDYYTRGGLDLQTRELLTFAVLSSLGGADAQLKAHVQGNLNVGNSRQKLLDVVTQLLPYIGYPRSLNAIAAINSVIEK